MLRRGFSTSCSCLLKLKRNQLPPRPTLRDDEFSEVRIKGGGRGGQAINKSNTKIQLKHHETGIVVSSQFSRSADANRKRARELLALKVEEKLLGPASRLAIVAEFEKERARRQKRSSRKKQKKRLENGMPEIVPELAMPDVAKDNEDATENCRDKPA